jgi:hypothetical protein
VEYADEPVGEPSEGVLVGVSFGPLGVVVGAGACGAPGPVSAADPALRGPPGAADQGTTLLG